MTSPTGNPRRTSAESAARLGFTLIELILVMSLLAIVAAIATPQLKGFFKGRTLDAEARRFLALTRHAQDRAVTESVPMILWIEPKANRYGLEMQPGYQNQNETDTKALEFTLDPKLEIQADMAPLTVAALTPEASSIAVPGSRTPITSANAATPEIVFMPEGFPTLTSPSTVWLREPDGESVAIALARNRLRYEIQSNSVPTQSRSRP